MSTTFTYTGSETFTRVHAKRISYRVATDLKRMQRLYNSPTNHKIEQYDKELVELLTAGFIEKVTYGFRRGDDWIEPTLRYTAFELSSPGFGDDPGRVRPGANIGGASFYTFLTYSAAWDELSTNEQAAFKNALPFIRSGAAEPGISGYFQRDLSYSAGGRGLQRESVRSFR